MIELRAVPFDAKEIEDPETGELTYDRIAVSRDYADWFSAYFENGIIVPGGGALSGEMQVTHSSGLTVRIQTGKIVINGRLAWVEQAESIDVEMGGSLPRIDRIIAELNLPDDRGIYIKVLRGTPASSPVAPALMRTEDIYQMSLAAVRVNANSSVIASVTDERGNEDVCGLCNVRVATRPPDGESAANISISDDNANRLDLTNENRTVEGAIGVLANAKQNSYYVNPYKNRVEIKTTQNWTAPNGVTKIGVFLVGGGQGGSGTSSGGYYGGNGGQTQFRKEISVNPGQSYSITIGAGGAGGTYEGLAGGNTTAFGITALGGDLRMGSGGAAGRVGSASGGTDGSPGGVTSTSNASADIRLGQGRSTRDPFSGTLYAGGGGAIEGAGGEGGGGKGGSSGTANTGGGGGSNSLGGSGIVVIYY